MILVLPIFIAGMLTGNLASLVVGPFPAVGVLVIRLALTALANAVVASVLAYVLTRKRDWMLFELRRVTCLVLIVAIYVGGASAGLAAIFV